MSVTGGFSINTNHLGDFDRGDFTIRENLTTVHGPHELHFGGEVVRLSNHIINTFRMDGNFTFNGQLSGDGLADFLLGRASDVRSGRRRVQGPQGHALGLLRAGQLARQPGADVEPGRSLGSVLCPTTTGRAAWSASSPARSPAVSECARRYAVRRRRSRPRVPDRRVGRQPLEHRPENRFRLPAGGGRQDQPPRRIRPFLHADPGKRLQPVHEHRAVRSGILLRRRVVRGSVRQRWRAEPVSRSVWAARARSGSHLRHAHRAAGRLRPGLPHASARLVEPVARASDRYRLGVPRRLHRQQGHLLLRRRGEQP